MNVRYCLFALLVATPVAARPFAPVTEDDVAPKSEIGPSVAAGELLPWSYAARHVRQGILINTYMGFDNAQRTPILKGLLELTLAERLTLHASAMNYDMSQQLEPGFGMLYDVLREEDHGVDVAVGGDYELSGWNHNSAVITRVNAGATAGDTRLQANAGFGLATAGGERYGERYGDVRLSGLHPVAQGLWAGIDTRARVDLERSMPEPSGELDWDMQAGPVASVAVGRFAVSATGGVSAWKLRSHETAKLGAMGALGVGAAF